MAVLNHLTLELNSDHILRAQGADPEIVRKRRPKLVEVAEWALREGLPLLTPVAVYKEYQVEEILHQRLILTEQGFSGSRDAARKKLTGKLLVEQLAAAEKLVVIVCTVGELLDEVSGGLMETDPLLGWALDALGAAAVEALSVSVCSYFGAQASACGQQTSPPLSPGMIGWPVEEGQPQVFSLLEGNEIGVRLTGGLQMQPRKSLSMVLGMGKEMGSGAQTCDFCAIRATCRYRENKGEKHNAGSGIQF